jgi:hypothetical protein
MFEPYYTFEIDELKPGKQDMCCMKMVYCPGLSRIDSSGGKVPIIDIYVRCYITRINNDLYMVTFCEKSLGFSNKFYVRIFNRKNLPSFYRLPILWALTNNVLTFKEDDCVDFVKNLEGKVLKTIDIFNEQDCIDRITYIELCKKNHCESI